MQFLKFIFVLFFSVCAVYACDEVGTVRFRNSDNSVGGLVGPNTKVHPNAYIGFAAKVCENAWIDEGAKILDKSIVRGNAWVREYSTIKDMASVYGDAILWGSRNAPVVISENSKIYGNARILTGTRISGVSEVFGSASLKDVLLSKNAKVCEGFKLHDLQITDDYFCNSENVLSRIELSLDGVSTEKFNSPKSKLKISATKGYFSTDQNVFVVTVNGIILDSSKIYVSRSEVKIDIASDIQEGQNTIVLTGRDEYNKTIDSYEVNFISGSGSKLIPIQFESPIDSLMDVKVKYKYDDSTYEGDVKYTNGMIELKNIPLLLNNYSIELTAIGKNSFIIENYKSIEDIPETLNAYAYPEYIDDNGDFSDGLSSWKISHPQNISTEMENGKLVAKILGDNYERVEIAKRFRLSSFDAGITLETILPSISKLITDTGLPTVEFALISINNRKLNFKRYQLSDSAGRVKQDSSLNDVKGGDFVVYLRLNPSNALKYPLTPLKMVSISKPDYFIHFVPYHLNAKNVSPAPLASTINPNCTNPAYDVSNDDRFNIGAYPDKPSERIVDDNFNFFSAGSAWFMSPQVLENRIHATYVFYTNRPEYHIVENPTLLIAQNEDVKKEVALSNCVARDLNQLDFKDQFNSNKNLVKYMFSIPFPNSEAEQYLDTSAGSRVSLYLKAKISNGHESFYKLSNEIDVPILIASDVDRAYWFGVVYPNGLDHYDSPSEGMLRTGGDKWVIPYYQSVIKNMVWTTSFGWKINDFSKLNGGHFPGHASHNNGLNGDLSTSGFKFENISDNSEWNTILTKIDNFFKNNKNIYDVISTFFVTRYKDASGATGGFDTTAIDSRFRNRCLGDDPWTRRYISFNTEDVEKSFLRHAPGHSDHLHIRFNNVYDSGMPSRNIFEPITHDLDDLWFEFVDGTMNGSPIKKLKITAKNSNFPSSYIKVLWRYQDNQDFDQIDSSIQYGRWPTSTAKIRESSDIIRKTILKANLLANKHIYVTFANILNGNCVQKHAEINMDFAKKAKRWSFKKLNGNYEIEGDGL